MIVVDRYKEREARTIPTYWQVQEFKYSGVGGECYWDVSNDPVSSVEDAAYYILDYRYSNYGGLKAWRVVCVTHHDNGLPATITDVTDEVVAEIRRILGPRADYPEDFDDFIQMALERA